MVAVSTSTREHARLRRARDEALQEHDGQRLVINGVSWAQYDALCRTFADQPGLRMTYLMGTLELMSPSRKHELDKKTLGRLVEAFGDETGLDLFGYGSTTFRKKAAERGLEPDECYCLGAMEGTTPQLAIEVSLSRGVIPKLEVYRGLGIREVWEWHDDRLIVHVLRAGGYVKAARSELLPSLDLELLSHYACDANQPRAVREYRKRLRRGRTRLRK